MASAFHSCPLPVSIRTDTARQPVCETRPPRRPSRTPPKPPNDPTPLRTESERRRNQPPKPLRRRAHAQKGPDWDNLPSVQLVRSGEPESGEDYWMEPSGRLSDAVGDGKKKKKKKIDASLRNKLKKEVVSPYTQNWILWVAAVVLVLVVLTWLFGGEETVPIIRVPDL